MSCSVKGYLVLEASPKGVWISVALRSLPGWVTEVGHDRLAKSIGYFEPNELERLDRSRKGDLVEGEEVRICRDVSAKGIPNALGMTGTVTDVWTGCEVDPACCCNELATAPITVSLRPEGAAADAEWLAYFAEEELEVIRAPAVVASGAINWAERTM